MKYFSQSFFILFSLLFLAQPIQAQEETQLDTVTIVSTRLPLRADETGRNISVITAEQIRLLPVTSVDEVLRYIPGLEMQNRGAFGVQGDILLRGSTFSQVLVLLDGMRINDPLTGHFNSSVPVSLAEIERIEVLRGPAASLYGPDAVGGVVHILTKSFSKETGKEVNANLAGGENGLVVGQLGAFYGKEDFKLGLSGSLNRSDGQTLPSGLKSDFTLYNFSGSAGFRLGKAWRLAARSGYDQRLFNAQYFYTRSPFDESREQTTQWWNQARLSREGERSQTDFNLGYKVSTDSFLFNPAFSANIHRTTFLNFMLHHTMRLSSRSQLAVGGQADRRAIESTDRGNHADNHVGAYVMGSFRPITGLSLTASLRGDWDENYGFELLPQLNASYRLGQVVLRGASGRSIRAADYTERFISTNLPGPLSPGRNLGNPDLQAETAWSHEIGADYRPSPGIRFSTSLFLRDGRNLIDYVMTPAEEIPNADNLIPGASYFYTQNLAQVRTQGLELEAWFQRSFGKNHSFQASVGYTLLDSRNDENPDQVTKYLSNHARHLFTLAGNLQLGAFSVSFQGLWKDRVGDEAPEINAELARSYTVWHGQAGYDFLQQKLRVYLQVKNIFNAQYADILGAKMPDRWLMAGVQFRIR